MNFEFGVLPSCLKIEANEWVVEPVAKCEDIIEKWQNTGPSDHWVHPYLTHTERLTGYDLTSRAQVFERLSGSEKAPVLWRVPPTHRLVYRGSGPLDPVETKHGIATFLIYFLGTVHGIEVQHADWAVVGRQRKKTGGMFVPRDSAALLNVVASWYTALLSRDVRTTITSALYLHNHVPSYEFDWERFAWQYSVFDAAWFVRNGRGGGPHKERLSMFSQQVGMVEDTAEFERWIALRNDLLHQALWAKVVPGHRPSDDVRLAYLSLRLFSTIALLAAVGYRGPGLQADWRSQAKHDL